MCVVAFRNVNLYALRLDYPGRMKNTFTLIQEVTIEVG